LTLCVAAPGSFAPILGRTKRASAAGSGTVKCCTAWFSSARAKIAHSSSTRASSCVATGYAKAIEGGVGPSRMWSAAQ
jgi:hypothetical protein